MNRRWAVVPGCFAPHAAVTFMMGWEGSVTLDRISHRLGVCGCFDVCSSAFRPCLEAPERAKARTTNSLGFTDRLSRQHKTVGEMRPRPDVSATFRHNEGHWAGKDTRMSGGYDPACTALTTRIYPSVTLHRPLFEPAEGGMSARIDRSLSPQRAICHPTSTVL